jgi:succinoglycan biosynthesis protein ExoO
MENTSATAPPDSWRAPFSNKPGFSRNPFGSGAAGDGASPLKTKRIANGSRQRLLIVTRHTPLPWEDGAGAYLHDMARYLAGHGFAVDVLWLEPHDHLRWGRIWRLPGSFDPAVRLHLPEGIRLGRRFVFPGIVWLPFKANLFDRIRRVLKKIGIDPPRRGRATTPAAGGDAGCARRAWMSPPSKAQMDFVQRFSEKHRPDVVIANYAWMCPILDLPGLRSARHACLAHDVAWKRAVLSAPPKEVGAAPEISRQDEAQWLRRAGVIIAISESDAGEMRALAPAATVVIAPKALEARTPFAESGSQGILFVGSDNAFNAEGLEWFLRQVWPEVRRESPGATLDVCGSIDRAVTLRPDGVAFHGMVPSLDAFYRRAAVAIVPLLRATGMNIKLVDAAAFGRAIVATPNTLAGAPFLREAAVVAATPGEFAAAVRRLLADPGARAAAAGRVLAAVRAHLAPGACYGPLAALLGENR